MSFNFFVNSEGCLSVRCPVQKRTDTCVQLVPHNSDHITSHHITSHHVTSRHITSHHITSHHITSHHITSHHITSHHNSDHNSDHITSHHITSHHITSHHITSHHITSHHITSHHISFSSLCRPGGLPEAESHSPPPQRPPAARRGTCCRACPHYAACHQSLLLGWHALGTAGPEQRQLGLCHLPMTAQPQ